MIRAKCVYMFICFVFSSLFFSIYSSCRCCCSFQIALNNAFGLFFLFFSLSRSSKIKWNYSQGRTDKMEYIMHTHTHT